VPLTAAGKQNQAIEEIKSVVTVVQEDRVKVVADIDNLRQIKVNREELQTKADVCVALVKADKLTLDRLVANIRHESAYSLTLLLQICNDNPWC
jgi:hypothetical protein